MMMKIGMGIKNYTRPGINVLYNFMLRLVPYFIKGFDSCALGCILLYALFREGIIGCIAITQACIGMGKKFIRSVFKPGLEILSGANYGIGAGYYYLVDVKLGMSKSEQLNGAVAIAGALFFVIAYDTLYH